MIKLNMKEEVVNPIDRVRAIVAEDRRFLETRRPGEPTEKRTSEL